ncbi:MAG: AAA family ATPase [Actinomycetota bacterium]
MQQKKDDAKKIFFCGVKGGCGNTFISNCIATYFAEKIEKNILLLDLSMCSSNRIIYNLTEKEVKDLGNVEGEIDKLDLTALRNLVINLENNLNLILPPINIVNSLLYNRRAISRLLGILENYFDIIFIDFPRLLVKFLFPETVKEIDKFIFISEPNYVSTFNLSKILDFLNHDGLCIEADIAINKFNLRPSISPTGLNNYLSYPIKAFIPYDKDIEFLFLNKGPSSIFKYNLRIVKSIIEMSNSIYGDLDFGK